MSATQELGRFVAECSASAIPPETREQARRAFLDTLGVLVAGCEEEAPRIVAGWVREQGGALEASVIGHSLAATAADAALVNGTSAHALDWDDVSVSMRGHPSVPLVPAIIALGEKLGAPGSLAVEAYVLGFEVQARLGLAIGEAHYALGWHATSTFGTVGAAAASSRMLGLDAARTATALSIAASLASGLQVNFGTMTKPLHAGWAARNGIVAASLAAAGLTASANAIGAPNGLLHAASGGRKFDDGALTANLGERWDILERGIGVKLYPCCYATHRAVDAALEIRDRMLMDEVAIHPDRIGRIQVKVSEGGLTPLIDHPPTTGLEAKFSMEYCVASALLDGFVRLPSFDEAAIARPVVRDLLGLVETDDGFGKADFPIGGEAEVRVEVREGNAYKTHLEVPRGDPKRPLTWGELAGKFSDAAGDRLGDSGVERAVAAIEGLDDIADVSEIVALIS